MIFFIKVNAKFLKKGDFTFIVSRLGKSGSSLNFSTKYVRQWTEADGI